MPRIFIDGAAGTVGMALSELLSREAQYNLLVLPEAKRRDIAARQKAMSEADVVVVCLPDEAAEGSVALIQESNPHARILDASAQHRCAPGWVYGLPEVVGEAAIRFAKQVANPGCFATGCILLARPLADELAKEGPPWLPFQGFTGYSAGGKEASVSVDQPWLAQLGVAHRHLPEIKRYGDVLPVLTTMVGSWYQGMMVQATVPIPFMQVWAAYERAYGEVADIELLVPKKGQRRFMAKCNNGTNRVSIMVVGQPNGGTTVAAAYDNLGKGSAGAAAANLRLMLSEEAVHG